MSTLLPHLAKELKIGSSLTLKNRLVMSAMTRNRADPGSIPNDLMALYYKQRASAGAIISEGIFIEELGSEWPNAPGIWNDKQVAGWKKITDTVKAAGGKIVGQIWHIGRVAHPLHQGGRPNVGPSAVKAEGGKFRLLDGHPGYVTPKAIEDPAEYVAKYKQAAINAKAAGFDGIELHAANGYLPNQFLEAHSNKRTDAYGGSPEKRAKFVLDILKEFIAVWGDSKLIGIKLTPCGGYNDMGDAYDVAVEEYKYLLQEIDKLNIGYICLGRHFPLFDPTGRATKMDVIKEFKPYIKNAKLFLNADVQGAEADKLIAEGVIDGAVIGRPFIANPNLFEKLQTGQELKHPDFAKLYSDGPAGYTDY
ncbi:hypothetical protein HDU76_000303 [Blyttiomyces sp. JEL0837]|nr:hypothetical protein HDU76_000303 [Blyttiomyces sp. JEL0837]